MASDAARVRALVRAAYARWVPVIDREPRPMTADYDRAIVDHVIDLYEDADELIGLIEMVPEPAGLLVENLAVLPVHQHRGIGDALLQHAEACARERGLTELRLYTNAAFGSNIAFYARRGFVESRREVLAAGGELVHMTKAVGPA